MQHQYSKTAINLMWSITEAKIITEANEIQVCSFSEYRHKFALFLNIGTMCNRIHFLLDSNLKTKQLTRKSKHAGQFSQNTIASI